MAEAPYEHVTFGNFENDSNTVSEVVSGEEGSIAYSYYFVDKFELLSVEGASPTINLGTDTILCEGNAITLNAGNPGSDYLWSTDESSSSITVTQAGTYSVTVSNECGVAEDEITITTVPVESAFIDTTICNGQTYAIGDSTYTETGVYTLIVPNGGTVGCDLDILLDLTVLPTEQQNQTIAICADETYEASFLLTVLKPVRIYLPTALSPNDDGVNDQFYPQGEPNPQIARLGPLRIYNRWGGLVFERDNLRLNASEDGWDGRGSTQELETSLFVYVLEYELQDGSKELISGDIMLVR